MTSLQKGNSPRNPSQKAVPHSSSRKKRGSWEPETVEGAQDQKNSLIEGLERSSASPALRLLKKLKKCSKLRPCGSGACPRCMREFRIAYIKAATDDLFPFGPFRRLSVIPAGGRVRLGELEDYDLAKFIARIRKNLERKGPSSKWVLICIDVSLNEEQGRAPYWQVHLYMLTPASSMNECAWRSVFPTDSRDPRPVHENVVAQADEWPCVFSYALKSQFYRRSSYVADNGRRNTRPFNLKRLELVELSLFLDRYPIEARLICHRMKITRSRDRLKFHPKKCKKE